MMNLAAEQLQHLAGVFDVTRLAKDLSTALGDRVAGEYNAFIDAGCNVSRFLFGEARNQFVRRLAATDSALGAWMRCDNFKRVTGLFEQLLSLWRLACKDEAEGLIGHCVAVARKHGSESGSLESRSIVEPSQLHVLYEDNHLLAVAKPPGIATMGVPAGKLSLLDLAKAYVKEKYHKPGNVYLGIVSRLDAPVTGVLLIARTSKAAARLTEQFRLGTVEKVYWAVVEGTPDSPEGTCVDWMRKDERHRKMHIVAKGHAEAKEARLSYRTLQSVAAGTLLEVRLDTGRKHQIRLQLAHRGLPIIGDRKYGSTHSFDEGIALHSRYLRLQHPVLKTELALTAKLPRSWRIFGITT